MSKEQIKAETKIQLEQRAATVYPFVTNGDVSQHRQMSWLEGYVAAVNDVRALIDDTPGVDRHIAHAVQSWLEQQPDDTAVEGKQP